MVVIWLFFACAIAGDPQRTLSFLWKGYLLAAAGATAFGVAEYFGYVQSLALGPEQRAKGPFKDPNVFGPFLVPATLYCLMQVRNRGSWRAGWSLPLFLLFSFGIFLSFSRGAWLNFAVSLGLFMVLSFALVPSNRRRLNWILTATAVTAAAAIMVMLALSSTTVRERFLERAVITQSYDLEEGGRFAVQQMSLRRIGITPLGIGPGRSKAEFPQDPHNIYLHIPLEGGWLAGLSWYLFAVVTMFQGARLLRWRSDLRDDLVVAWCSLVGVLAQSAFISSTHWRHMWLLFAMIWALIVTARRDAVAVPASSLQTLRAVT
jgi:O-antigen ligase